MTRNSHLSEALGYAARGWHVIPIRPGAKAPAVPTHCATACTGTDPWCARAGKHLGWQDRATTDPSRITRAWTANPALGVGIACGPSHLVVIDLDTPKPGTPRAEGLGPGVHDGADALAELAERLGETLDFDTYTVATPSGGTHLYYAPPAGAQLTNTASTLAPLVDTRAWGGQVLAPPTPSTRGEYRVIVDTCPAPLPKWIHDRLSTPHASRPSPPPAAATRPATPAIAPGPARPAATSSRAATYVARAVGGECARVRQAVPGTRNQVLFSASIALGQLVGGGHLSATGAADALSDAAATHYAQGFTAREAHTAIASGLARGHTEPRALPTSCATAA